MVQGGGGVSARGLETQREIGTLEGHRGSRSCRGPQSAELLLGGALPLSAAAQARPNRLLLCSRSCSRSAETAGREVSLTPLHARPDPHPEPLPLPESPAQDESRLGQDCSAQARGASGFGRWALSEVARGSDRTSCRPSPRDISGVIGWAEASQDKTCTHLSTKKPLPHPPGLSLPLGERTQLLSTGEPWLGQKHWRGGGQRGWPDPSGLAPRRAPLLPAWAARGAGVGGSGALGRRTN